jgi:chemotaxis protein CheX
MRAEYANPFIRSAKLIFEKEIKITLNRKDLVKKSKPSPTMPVSIVIGVTGPVRGQVVYSMDDNFAYNVTKAMMPNKLPHDIKKMINSAVSEIANMITGRASMEMAGENDLIDITPPAVLTGPGMHMDFLNIPTISLSFLSGIGVLEINIALTEDKRG